MLKAGLPGVGHRPATRTPPSTPPSRWCSAPQFGGNGGAAADLSVLFTNAEAVGAGEDTFPTRRRRVAVRGCRQLSLSDMVRHRASGQVRVAPGGSRVTLDGVELAMDPVQSVPLSRLYFL